MSNTLFKHSIKNEIKDTISIGIPLISAQLIYASSGFIGTAMVAHLGQAELAASGLVSTIWISLSVLFFGILHSVGVLTSHQFGAKNNKAISEIMGQAYLLGIVIIFLIFLILMCMPFFLRWSAQPPEVLKLSRQYMFALIWTIPALVILIISEEFLAGIGRTKIVLRISLLVVPIEIPLIYLLIFGKLGFPKCGIAGIGYGFAITYTATAIGLILYLWRAKSFKQYQVLANLNKINMHYLKELIRVGLPMGFMHVIELSTFLVATFWVAQFGITFLAAHQIALQYLGFTSTIFFALAQAVTVRVGHAVGRQDILGVRSAIYVGLLISLFCSIVIALIFYFIPTLFLRLDINIHDFTNQNLVQKASLLLGICGVLLIFDGFRIIGFGALRALKDTKFCMYASFVSFWLVGLSLAFLFAFVFSFQGGGIWWGLTFGTVLGAFIIYERIRKKLVYLKENNLKKLG